MKVLILGIAFLTATVKIEGQKAIRTAAVTQCTMLSTGPHYNGLSKREHFYLLDTMLILLAERYHIDEITVLQKDSVALNNSSWKGIGKFRKADRQLLNGKQYDYYIKIYTDYWVSGLLGGGIANTAQPKLTIDIAVFDSNGKRIWFPDSKAKGGLAFGNTISSPTYYSNAEERKNDYLELFRKGIAKIFRQH
ncbi:MAG TPA: hypothetical protein VF476_04940 [Chitinophagaceae bacterium]